MNIVDITTPDQIYEQYKSETARIKSEQKDLYIKYLKKELFKDSPPILIFTLSGLLFFFFYRKYNARETTGLCFHSIVMFFCICFFFWSFDDISLVHS